MRRKKAAPPSAVGGLNCFLFVGDVMKLKLKDILKSPWTALHGTLFLNDASVKGSPTQRSGRAWRQKYKSQEWNSAYAKLTKARGLTKERALFGKLRDRDFFTVSELAELALLVAQGLSFLRKSTNLVQLGNS
jgi:hypothetical protein